MTKTLAPNQGTRPAERSLPPVLPASDTFFAMRGRLLLGDDGKQRCWWCGTDPQYVTYHDTEWGHALHGEDKVFEKITLEGMQAGLSWITILRKRENFRTAFANFRIEKVAAFGDADVARLMGDAGIVRNRAKIEAAISNARVALGMLERGESLDQLVWSFAPTPARGPIRTDDEIAASTSESKAMSKELLRRGFRFVGPTTMYAFMQSSGMVNDHLIGCETQPALSNAATSKRTKTTKPTSAATSKRGRA